MKIVVTSFGCDYHAKIFYKHVSQLPQKWKYYTIQEIGKDWDILRDIDVIWNWGMFGDAFHFYKIAKRINPDIITVNTWTGTDIINFANRVTETPFCRQCMLQAIDYHTSTSDIYCKELTAIGIDAYYIPAIPEKPLNLLKPFPTENRFATYIPPNRKQFYRYDIILEIAKMYPDIEIDIYALSNEDKEKTKPPLKNIHFMGYVTGRDKLEIFRNHKAFISILQHGGIGVMLIEFLQAGRYGIANRNIKYTYLVKTFQDIKDAIENIMKTTEPNILASKYYRKHFSPQVVRKLTSKLIKDITIKQEQDKR